MPWKVIQKKYNKNAPNEGIYHIQCYLPSLIINVYSKFHVDKYKWFLNSPSINIEFELIGIAGKITDVEACEMAMVIVKERMRVLNEMVELAGQSIKPKMFEK